jgi:lysozyme
MRIDKRGEELLHTSEGLELKAYLDTGGVWTIGWGNTSINGKPVTKGMTCTKEEADEEWRKDVDEAEASVKKLVKVPLTQGQFNALVDFVYNVGEGQFSKSTLLRLLNKGDYEGACKQFPRWVYDNGKKINGLVKRNRKRQEMFMS